MKYLQCTDFSKLYADIHQQDGC